MSTHLRTKDAPQDGHFETMSRADLPRSGPALGGIGTGSVELRKDGIFRHWTVFNNAPLFGGPTLPFQDDETLFFVVRWQEPGQHPQLRLLQIESDCPHPAGAQLQFYTFRWMRGVDKTEFRVQWPFAQLTFIDPSMPFTLAMEAFSPFIPHQTKDSSLPGIYFNFTLKAKPGRRADVLLVANLRHMVGHGSPKRRYVAEELAVPSSCGFRFEAENVDPDQATAGQMVLLSLDPRATSHHIGWSHRHTFYEPLLRDPTLPNLNTATSQNAKDPESDALIATYPCFGSLGWRTRIAPGPEKNHTFLLTWFCPNAWASLTKKDRQKGRSSAPRFEGHAYANHFQDAVAVAEYMARNRTRLESQSRAFTSAFYQSSLPAEVLNAINAQLNTFITSTWFTKNGDFGVQEGLTPEQPWGPMATIDVGMYGSIATAALFPELDRATWEVHRRLQAPSGDVSHGVARDFGRNDGAHEGVKSRLDLAPQFVIQAVRHFHFSQDREWLRQFWPSLRAAVEYTLSERDRDGDGLPEMSGSNSSYDNFPMFGPASYVASQWISALAHAASAASALGLTEDADRYTSALSKARARFEEKLWNGRYFSLYNDEGGEHGGHDEGCLSDQIIGQWANHLTGLGDICDRRKIKASLRHIVKRNWERGVGLFNCRWPEDSWLHPVAESCWYDQANTFWTGVEYAFASFLAYEGRGDEAIALTQDVERRYREANRTWDHMEWGGHYFRPMSAWAILHGLLGLVWQDQTVGFAPSLKQPDITLLFTHPRGYGLFHRKLTKTSETIRLQPISGAFSFQTLQLGLLTENPGRISLALGPKPISSFTRLPGSGRMSLQLSFSRPLTVTPKSPLLFSCQS